MNNAASITTFKGKVIDHILYNGSNVIILCCDGVAIEVAASSTPNHVNLTILNHEGVAAKRIESPSFAVAEA